MIKCLAFDFGGVIVQSSEIKAASFDRYHKLETGTTAKIIRQIYQQKYSQFGFDSGNWLPKTVSES